MFEVRIGPEVALRLLEARHSDELYQLIRQNWERLRVWVPWLRLTSTVDQTREYVQRSLHRFANGKGFSAGIWLGDQLVGQIALEYIDRDNRLTEIGYWIDAGVEGKGIVTKACQHLVDYAFGELDLNRVQIRCAVENTRSRAIAQRLGFVEEGVLRQVEQLETGYVDLVIYGMLRHEWLESGRNSKRSRPNHC